MNPISSNRFSIEYESAVNHLHEHLTDMDLDVMCDELGITQADILDRFKDRVHQYWKHIDRGVEDALNAEYAETDSDGLDSVDLDRALDDEEEDAYGDTPF
jgi:hypothetical protein